MAQTLSLLPRFSSVRIELATNVCPGFLEKEDGVHIVGPATCTPETTQITDTLVASLPSCHSIIVSSMCERLWNDTMQNPTLWLDVTHVLGLATSALLEPPPRTVSCACAAGTFPKELASWALPESWSSGHRAACEEGLPLMMNSLTLCRTVSWEGLCPA